MQANVTLAWALCARHHCERIILEYIRRTDAHVRADDTTGSLWTAVTELTRAGN